MRTELTQAGIIAIPIKNRQECNMSPVPNFFVIEAISGRVIANSPNLISGELSPTECSFCLYKVCHREILPATNTLREEYVERVYIQPETFNMPVDIVPYIYSYSRIKENIEVVNRALSFFSFRGIMQELILEVDEEVLDQIIAQENLENDPQ